MLLVPLYGPIKGLDKSQKIGIRVSSMAMGFLNASLIWGLFFYLAITGYLDSVTGIWAWLILIFVIVIYVIPFIGMFVLSRNQKKIIFCVIKEHPYYSINQIAHELVVKPSALEKEINKMKEKGEIERVEEGGQLIWKVNKPL
jgi:predicted transcriptional regulator